MSGRQDGQHESVGIAPRAEPPGSLSGPLHEYDFVNGTLVDEATLERAVGLARKWNVTPHDVLLANGWIRPRAYYRALANNCGASFFEANEKEILAPHRKGATPRDAIQLQLLKWVQNGRANVAFSPSALSPLEMKDRFASDIGRVAITTPHDLRAGIQKTYAKRLMSEAVYGLVNRYPGQSAGEGLVRGQRLGLAAIFAVILISAGLAPILTLHVLAGLATAFFGMVVALRVIACINLITVPLEWFRNSPQRVADTKLPVYTLLVPLFQEAEVLEGLTRALMRLDYPALGSKRTKIPLVCAGGPCQYAV